MPLERRTSKLLVEPAAVATGDIAFNLIIVFLVCASTQPDSGRKQELPRSEQTKTTQEKRENIELALSRQ
jgi:biopolymer transport protein ExbD